MKLAPHPFTLRQWQYAIAVADELSFRRAAIRCHVSQPALSAQVASLEGALGLRLFERTQRRVSVTVAGAPLLARARALLVDADALAAAARAADPFVGTLRLGVIPTVAPYLLPSAAPTLRAAFPRLTVWWREEKTEVLAALLRAGELDAALVAVVPEVEAFERAVVREDEFVLAMPKGHALAGAGPLRSGALDGALVLLLDDGHCFRDQALAVCARANAQELGFRATSLSTLAQMVAGGAGVTLLPQIAVATEAARAALVVRRFVDPPPSRTLALIWRRASALGDALREVANRLAEPG
jgi:LysR family hydrogen peroxide-inducible transcriptional activator